MSLKSRSALALSSGLLGDIKVSPTNHSLRPSQKLSFPCADRVDAYAKWNDFFKSS